MAVLRLLAWTPWLEWASGVRRRAREQPRSHRARRRRATRALLCSLRLAGLLWYDQHSLLPAVQPRHRCCLTVLLDELASLGADMLVVHDLAGRRAQMLARGAHARFLKEARGTGSCAERDALRQSVRPLVRELGAVRDALGPRSSSARHGTTAPPSRGSQRARGSYRILSSGLRARRDGGQHRRRSAWPSSR